VLCMSRQVNKTLQNINLGENLIGAVGTTAIAEALKVRAACLGARFASLPAIFHVHLALFPPLCTPGNHPPKCSFLACRFHSCRTTKLCKRWT